MSHSRRSFFAVIAALAAIPALVAAKTPHARPPLRFAVDEVPVDQDGNERWEYAMLTTRGRCYLNGVELEGVTCADELNGYVAHYNSDYTRIILSFGKVEVRPGPSIRWSKKDGRYVHA